MRKWLSRLTFSFLVIAAACGYEAFEGFAGRRPARQTWQHIGLTVVAVVAFVMFLVAMKVRHASNSDPQ